MVDAANDKAKKKRRATMSRVAKAGSGTDKSEAQLRLEMEGAPLAVRLSNARARLQVAEYGERWYSNTESLYRKGKSQVVKSAAILGFEARAH